MRIYFIVFALFISCQNEMLPDKLIDNNYYYYLETKEIELTQVKEILKIYIPKSILDKRWDYQMGFDIYAYEFYNGKENYPKLIITHPDQTDKYSNMLIYNMAKVLKKRYQNESDSLVMDSFYFKNNYIIYFKHQNNYEKEIPIQTYITYKVSPDFKQAYTFEVECPYTSEGDMLRDSIYKIFASIKFKNWSEK